MTRWAFVVDLNRCVGCQTCTSACKHANATAPGVQWRKVLDFEAGTYPDVSRAFVPVGCMHCDNPSCMEVCPSTATGQRDDGIVSIDYDLCIGCAYCAVACPYQARYRVDEPAAAYGKAMSHESARENPARLGVAQKCTMCADIIDEGLQSGLVPGVHSGATPACVWSCISGALQMGDLDDPQSDVSRLMRDSQHFVMHEELGNGPAIHYLFDRQRQDETPVESAPMLTSSVGQASVSSQPQSHWDWRAGANFAFGGTGAGLMAVAMLAGLTAPVSWWAIFLALALVGFGLLCVLLEIGRKWRFLNVLRNLRTSWMTREAWAAIPFIGFGGLSWILGAFGQGGGLALGLVGAGFGLVFLYCQAQILRASKAIPAWRQPQIIPLILATGLAEGAGIFAAIAFVGGGHGIGLALLLSALVLGRWGAWNIYREALGKTGAPTQVFPVLDGLHMNLWHGALGALIAYGVLGLPESEAVLALAGLGVVLTGWVIKFALIMRAGLNQGYAINRMPARGAGKSSPGIKPGWTVANQ